MGNIKNQKSALAAQANIKKTWEDLLNEPQVPDRDAPLGEIASLKYDGIKTGSILHDPDSPVVACLTFIY